MMIGAHVPHAFLGPRPVAANRARARRPRQTSLPVQVSGLLRLAFVTIGRSTGFGQFPVSLREMGVPMERGLLVELSPNEETALQRIAQGLMLTTEMAPRHLARLKQLALIEETGTNFRLTALGRRRLELRGTAPPKAD